MAYAFVEAILVTPLGALVRLHSIPLHKIPIIFTVTNTRTVSSNNRHPLFHFPERTSQFHWQDRLFYVHNRIYRHRS